MANKENPMFAHSCITSLGTLKYSLVTLGAPSSPQCLLTHLWGFYTSHMVAETREQRVEGPQLVGPYFSPGLSASFPTVITTTIVTCII